MSLPIIHFAHANGFPALTYNRIFELLRPGFEIGFLDRLGHDPRFPVTDNWEHLKDELREAIVSRHDRPVIGVGHSLGGVLHLMVAAEIPELYSRIILLDAPIISRFSSHGLRLLKLTGLMDRYSPARMTRYRRSLWQSREEALQHFRSKPKFAAFDPGVLQDYVDHGVVRTDRGYELFFLPQVEAKIYRTLPHQLPSLRGKLSVPTAYVGGSRSREARLAGLSFMKRHFDIDFHFVGGSHLFPFEHPIQTAEMLRNICRTD